MSSNVTNGLVDFLRNYRPERLKWQGGAVCPLVLAVLVRRMCTEIPLFVYAAEIAAAMMLLFLRKSTA